MVSVGAASADLQDGELKLGAVVRGLWACQERRKKATVFRVTAGCSAFAGQQQAELKGNLAGTLAAARRCTGRSCARKGLWHWL